MVNIPAVKDKSYKRGVAGERIAFTLIWFVTFIIYILTLAPDLTWSHWGADGGDFVVAVVTRKLPHPPGFPLYLIIARLIAFIPLGGVAWRMNLLSAMMASGAVFFTAMTLREQEVNLWSTTAASLSLGFAPLFWSQAVITEVYTSAAFFISLTHYINTVATKHRWSTLSSGISWGMAIAVHPTTAIAAFYFWLGRKKVWNGIIAGVVFSILCYATLIFWGTGSQRWADIDTVKGWLEYVSGSLYWDYAFRLPMEYVPRRTLSWVTLFAQQFTPIGAVLIIVGIYQNWRLSRKTTIGLFLCVSIITLYAITYNSIDSFIYLVPILPLFTLFLGKGMDWLANKGIPRFAVLIIPIILVVYNWQSISLRMDHTAALWLERTLTEIPNGAVVLTDEDYHTFTLWYAQEVTGLREDVLVVDTRLWGFQPYYRFISNIIAWSPYDIKALGATRELCAIEDKGVVCH